MPNDPIVEAIKKVSEGALENDKLLLSLVKEVIERMLELEKKVDVLMYGVQPTESDNSSDN